MSMTIKCKFCGVTGAYGSTMRGWRLAKNCPFQYVCRNCVELEAKK